MEHPCQQCGTTVEDGRPFCPQCRSPQIHVPLAVTSTEFADNPAPFTGDERQAAENLSAGRSFSTEKGAVARAAIKAGLLGVFIGIIPFLGSVLTGSLAVFFYRRKNQLTVPAAVGWRLGGAASVVAFAINALFLTIRIFIFHGQQEYFDLLTRFAQSFGADSADPTFQAGIRSLLTPSGLMLGFLFGMMFALILGAFGGALASLFFRTGKPRS